MKTLSSGIIPDFNIPTRIYLKEDILNEIAAIIRNFGARAILISTAEDFIRFESVIQNLSSRLSKSDIGCIVYDEMPDHPTTEDIDSAVYFIKKTKCDMVIGIGGLESMNAAKAISVLTDNFFFCEELFNNPKIPSSLKLITIPAYPLFGMELIPMLYLADLQDRTRRTFSHPSLFPDATIADPRITLDIGEEMTAITSISTLSIATESVISKKNNGLINTMALRAIDLIFKNLPVAFRDPKNPAPRFHLAEASLMAGIAFSVSELSVSLAVGLALATHSSLSVEKGMCMILPHIMEYNLTTSPGKYVQMSKVMDEDVRDITVIEAAIKAVEGVRKIEIEVEIPQRLSQFDIPKNDLTRIADQAMRDHFIETAPRPLTRNEIETILIAAY